MKRLRANAAGQPAPKTQMPSRPPERYFTDGNNLYRFVDWVTRAGNGELATLEDCRTLRLLLVSGEYLTNASLRRVV